MPVAESKPSLAHVLLRMAEDAVRDENPYTAWLGLPAGFLLLAIGSATIRTGTYLPTGITDAETGTVAVVIGLVSTAGGLIVLLGATAILLNRRAGVPKTRK